MPSVRPQAWEQRFARAFADPVRLYEIFWGYSCPDYLAEVLRCPDPLIEWSACPATLKTTAIAARTVWTCLALPALGHRSPFFPAPQGPIGGDHPHRRLVLAPSESHLAVSWNETVAKITDSAFLQAMLKRFPGKSQAIQRDPTWMIHFANGSTTEFRISGTDGKPFWGRHADSIDLDEAQGFPMKAVPVLLMRRNPGCQLRVYGMVDGTRDGYLYHAHQDKDGLFRHFKTERYKSPLWSEAEQRQLERMWGLHSPEWHWYVLADWSLQSEAPWDLDAIARVTRLGEYYQPYEVSVEEFRETYGSDPAATFEVLPDFNGATVLLAADIGETQSPTNIGIFTLDENGQDRLELRLALHRWEAYERSKAFDYLVRRYRAVKVAIDCGSEGSAVVSNLLNPELFPGRNLQEVVLPVDFRTSVEMARFEVEPPPSEVPQDVVLVRKGGPPEKPTVVNQPLKHATTKWLRDRIFRGGLSLPNDLAMHDEFNLQRLVGNRYTDPQHTIDMLRCYAYARYMLGHKPTVPAQDYIEAPYLLPQWA